MTQTTVPTEITPAWWREALTLMDEFIAMANQMIAIRDGLLTPDGEGVGMRTEAGRIGMRMSSDAYRVAAFQVSKLRERARAAQRNDPEYAAALNLLQQTHIMYTQEFCTGDDLAEANEQFEDALRILGVIL